MCRGVCRDKTGVCRGLCRDKTDKCVVECVVEYVVIIERVFVLWMYSVCQP